MTVVEIVMLTAVVLVMGLLVAMLVISRRDGGDCDGQTDLLEET